MIAVAFSLVGAFQLAQADDGDEWGDRSHKGGFFGNLSKKDKKPGGANSSDEAKEVCADSSEGDSCSFTISSSDGEEKEIEGTCANGPQDEDELICKSGNKEKKGTTLENRIQGAEKMLARRENDFSRVEERLEKLIDFLGSKDIDTGALETDLETFQSKTDAILESIQSYLNILEELQENGSGTEELTNDDAKEAREEIKSLVADLKDFYQNTLKADISTAKEALNT